MNTLRKGYKQTELGLIPEDWKILQLNQMSSITRLAGYEYSTVWEEDENGEIIALRGFNIGQNRIIEREFVRINNKLSLKLKRSRLYKGDVIYPCVGTIGNAVVIEEDDKYHIQQNIARIIPNEEYILSPFLAYYLMSSFGLNEINKFNGSSSQPNILVGSLRKYSIILPSKSEQTAIATALSDADALISSLEKLIAKKRAIKQGAMQELLKPKEGWEVKNFGDLTDQIVGGGTPSRINPIYWGNEIPWVTVKDFATFSPYLTQEYITNEGLKCSASNLIPKGIIITSTRMALGKAVIYDVDVSINQDMKAIFLKKTIDTKFFYYWFQFNSKIIEDLGSGSTVMGLSLPDLRKIRVVFPPKSEQKDIATILSDMDAEIAGLEDKLSKYKQVKQGMMQELLTGRVRLID